MLVVFLLSGVCHAKSDSFQQVYIGFNGLHEPEVTYFHSEQEVRRSWLASNIKKLRLDEIVSKINFKKQVLLLVAVGDRGNVATGNIYIKQIINGDHILAYADVGVSGEDCKYSYDNSYPFSLSIAPKPKKSQFLSGFYIQNFSDVCKE